MGDSPRIDPTHVAEALQAVRARITAAGGGPEVAILPVTKAFGSDAVRAVHAAGAQAVGENYAQELVAKRDALADIEVHFIGRLQTNKVRQLAGLVDVYATVDRPKLIREIARRDPGARVLIQVNTTGETGKGGCPLDQVDELVEQARAAGLQVDGLMTVGPTEGGAHAARPGFRAVRHTLDRLGLTVCSMGMSGDLAVAVEEGSTQVRVGTAIFGPRGVPVRTDQGR